MTKTAQPLVIGDLSEFARALHRQLPEPQPTHLTLLNMLARAAGFQNYQHLHAQNAAPADTSDPERVAAALRFFDARGRMIKWPGKTNLQQLCLWGLWARLPREAQTERQVSEHLALWHLFGDAALLRRTLVEMLLLDRTQDGSRYLWQSAVPNADAAAVIAALMLR